MKSRSSDCLRNVFAFIELLTSGRTAVDEMISDHFELADAAGHCRLCGRERRLEEMPRTWHEIFRLVLTGIRRADEFSRRFNRLLLVLPAASGRHCAVRLQWKAPG